MRVLPAPSGDGCGLTGYASPAGAVLAREAAGKEWRALAPDAPLHSGDLLVALPGATLLGPKGAVRLNLVKPQYRFSSMPMLPERRLSPLHTLRREFPISMQPIRVTNHDYEAVLRLAP